MCIECVIERREERLAHRFLLEGVSVLRRHARLVRASEELVLLHIVVLDLKQRSSGFGWNPVNLPLRVDETGCRAARRGTGRCDAERHTGEKRGGKQKMRLA